MTESETPVPQVAPASSQVAAEPVAEPGPVQEQPIQLIERPTMDMQTYSHQSPAPAPRGRRPQWLTAGALRQALAKRGFSPIGREPRD
jgi:hypothetical protein